MFPFAMKLLKRCKSTFYLVNFKQIEPKRRFIIFKIEFKMLME